MSEDLHDSMGPGFAKSDMHRLERLEAAQESLRRQVGDVAATTSAIHKVLVGDGEYKRQGLVEMVDKHEKLIVRGGAAFCSIYFIWEVIKFIHPHIMLVQS